MAWAAFTCFFGGMVWQVAWRARIAARKDPMVYAYFHPYYALRSVLAWLIPYAARSMREHPVFFAASFLFHACAILLPFLVSAHVLLVYESWGIAWPYMADRTADVISIITLAALAFFAARRTIDPVVSYLTTIKDFLLLALVAAPFLTGIWAHLQWPGWRVVTLLHLSSGELLIALVPFTRLRHMIFFPFSRGYAGSEFGGVRHAKDW